MTARHLFLTGEKGVGKSTLIDRLLSRMRREGIVVSTPVHAENGAQLANVYAVVDEVWPKD